MTATLPDAPPQTPSGDEPAPTTVPTATAPAARGSLRVISWSMAQVLCCVALVAVPTLGYGRYFIGHDYVFWLLGACGLAGGAALLAVRRWRLGIAVLVSFLGLAAYLIWGIFRGQTRHAIPDIDTVRVVVTGIWHGVPRMLSVSIPADPSAELLVVPIVLTWICAAAAVMLALRLRSPLVALAPGLVAFVAVLLLTATSKPPRTWLTVVWIALALLALMLRANRPAASGASGTAGAELRQHQRSAARGTLLLGLPVLGIVVALAVLGAWLIPVADENNRFDPRRHSTPPVSIDESVSPLSYVQGQRIAPKQALFNVSFAGAADTAAPPVDRIPVAALDAYDGALWTVSGAFRRAGSVLPVVESLPSARPVSIHVEELQPNPYGPFLPHVGQPRRLSGVQAYIDPASGQLLRDGTGLSTFTLQSAVPQLSQDDQPGAAPSAAQDHSLPEPVPEKLTALADDTVAGIATPYGRLAALEAKVRTLGYNADATPGQSYHALVDFVEKGSGNIEQHAALFAVMARHLGLPTRIATGYLLDAKGQTGGSYAVSSADAFAWPEVALDGIGWVGFDPTDLSVIGSTPPKVTPPPQTNNGPQPVATTVTVDPNLRATPPNDRPTWLIVLAIVVVLLVLLLAGIVLGKVLRRRRRRTTGPPDLRIAGAWLSMTDSLRETGLRVSRSKTVLETAEALEPVAGAAVVGTLTDFAPLHDRALYSPVRPGKQDADDAWKLADRLASQSRARLPWWRRPVSYVDPRGLIRVPSSLHRPRWRSAVLAPAKAPAKARTGQG